ncbi:TraR/DksA family transcriptional regulator [Aestuariirhabdus haliotis]|uniref:TraR/DksA family transcriptional regulator n=1 Tax=Aestuariirhabdus haliotis TaxID=2918751 RepID=UPI0020BDA903|nr:TraR/DksA family transcriptional regulator [Aestuariirhabdus haliotis]MCL6418143.1 TraR/DksA family transcriptional regulator [Aestuariirhabdus haliotis]
MSNTTAPLTPAQEQQLKQALLEQRDELLTLLKQGQESSAVVELDQQAFGRVSRQDALLQQNMAKATNQQAENRLRQVTQALARVESGDFGYCLQCDRAIGFPRLEVRPETPLCLNCQSSSEN